MSLVPNTAVGLGPRPSSSSAAAAPARAFMAGTVTSVRTAAGSSPARSTARRAPRRRSAHWRIATGPLTRAIRRCPSPSRWLTAISPPRRSSTATEHWPAEQYHGSAPLADPAQLGRPAVDRGDEDAAHPLLLEHAQVPALLVVCLVGVAQD